MSTDLDGLLDHPRFVAAFRRRHQADVDAIEADLIARARRLDDAGRLDEAVSDALAAEYSRRVNVLIDAFTTAFVATAINSALLLDGAQAE